MLFSHGVSLHSPALVTSPPQFIISVPFCVQGAAREWDVSKSKREAAQQMGPVPSLGGRSDTGEPRGEDQAAPRRVGVGSASVQHAGGGDGPRTLG